MHVINMKNNDNKFVKLVGIIIILLLIVVIGLLYMPRMTDVREKAFRVEATRIVDSSKVAMQKFNDKEIELKNNNQSCHAKNIFCFTVSELKDLGVYKSESEAYVGKIIVDYENKLDNPQYYLYFKKSADLKIIGGFREDYINMGTLSFDSWLDEYEVCKCE